MQVKAQDGQKLDDDVARTLLQVLEEQGKKIETLTLHVQSLQGNSGFKQVLSKGFSEELRGVVVS